MRFFFDRCCPIRLARVICAFEDKYPVRHFDEDSRFVKDTPDVDWIRVLAGDQPPEWVIISMDVMITKNPHELTCLKQSGLRFFLLGRGWMKMSIDELVWKLVKAWPSIRSEAETSRMRLFEVNSGSSLRSSHFSDLAKASHLHPVAHASQYIPPGRDRRGDSP